MEKFRGFAVIDGRERVDEAKNGTTTELPSGLAKRIASFGGEKSAAAIDPPNETSVTTSPVTT